MRISKLKKEKISEQILYFLFLKSPQIMFTSHIAQEIARDEEFVKKILIGLKDKNLIIEVKKNRNGIDYKKRSRWKLSNQAYQIYKNFQKV